MFSDITCWHIWETITVHKTPHWSPGDNSLKLRERHFCLTCQFCISSAAAPASDFTGLWQERDLLGMQTPQMRTQACRDWWLSESVESEAAQTSQKRHLDTTLFYRHSCFVVLNLSLQAECWVFPSAPSTPTSLPSTQEHGHGGDEWWQTNK